MGLGSELDSLNNSVNNNAANAGSQMGNLDVIVNGNIGNAGSGLDSLGNYTNGTINDNLIDGSNDLQNALNNATIDTSSLTSDGSSFLTGLQEIGNAFVDLFTGKADSFGNDIVQGVSDVFNGTTSVFNNIIDDISTWIHNIVNSIWDDIKQLGSDIMSGLGAFLKGFVAWFEKFFSFDIDKFIELQTQYSNRLNQSVNATGGIGS